jgi:uncharacterized protein (DUF488 family)
MGSARQSKQSGSRAAIGPVFTIGHSTRTLDELVVLLTEHGVGTLADIRTAPGSRRMPWFAKAALAAELPAHGIGYEHVPELGGLRKPRPDSINTAWRNDAFRGYADHMATEEFERGVERLLALPRPVAAMCAEAVPWRCHRSLLGDHLVASGVPVIDIIGAGSAQPHRVTPFARVIDGRVTYPS